MIVLGDKVLYFSKWQIGGMLEGVIKVQDKLIRLKILKAVLKLQTFSGLTLF